MNNTARIQASFSLPEVLLEDKIERMGKNQTKMIIPKKRRAVKSSIPRVYAVQLPLCQCIFTCLERRPPLGNYTRLWAFLGDVRQKGSCGYGLVNTSIYPVGP